MSTWSTSFPGVISSGCGAPDGFEVHHETGRMLRIGSEARLCFDCGPNGGVYHPDFSGIAAALGWNDVADDLDSGASHITPAGVLTAMAHVRQVAAGLDKRFNRFEVHEHHALSGAAFSHSHTDGSEAHKHLETGPASFVMDRDENAALHLGGGGKRAFGKVPAGQQLPYVELTNEERSFRVVLTTARYINPDALDGFQDGYFNSGKAVGGTGQKFRSGSPKPHADWSRAAYRQTLDLYVRAIRLQALGYPSAIVAGPGAIPMATNRMVATFRLTPIYEILGWTPTFGPLP